MTAKPSWIEFCARAEGLLLRQRKALGLTQQDVAARIGVNVRTFKRFESEESEPTFRQAVRWARALGVHFAISTDCESDSSVTFQSVGVVQPLTHPAVTHAARPSFDTGEIAAAGRGRLVKSAVHASRVAA
jgi:transcriptional regulator with XRE-family HTH domain